MTAKETLKQWFSNLKKPTQAHFWAWLESYWHKSEKIPMQNIEGLDDALQDTASNTQFQAHLTDLQAHSDLFDNKVDKETGKGLSSNDYSDEEKQKVQDTANKRVVAFTVTGDVNKVAKITFEDGNVLTASFTDIDTTNTADVMLNSLNFNTETGVLTGVRSDGQQITVDLDGRYSLVGHTHEASQIGGLTTLIENAINGITLAGLGGISDAPNNGNNYVRKSGSWSVFNGLEKLPFVELDMQNLNDIKEFGFYGKYNSGHTNVALNYPYTGIRGGHLLVIPMTLNASTYTIFQVYFSAGTLSSGAHTNSARIFMRAFVNNSQWLPWREFDGGKIHDFTATTQDLATAFNGKFPNAGSTFVINQATTVTVNNAYQVVRYIKGTDDVLEFVPESGITIFGDRKIFRSKGAVVTLIQNGDRAYINNSNDGTFKLLTRPFQMTHLDDWTNGLQLGTYWNIVDHELAGDTTQGGPKGGAGVYYYWMQVRANDECTMSAYEAKEVDKPKIYQRTKYKGNWGAWARFVMEYDLEEYLPLKGGKNILDDITIQGNRVMTPTNSVVRSNLSNITLSALEHNNATIILGANASITVDLSALPESSSVNFIKLAGVGKVVTFTGKILAGDVSGITGNEGSTASIIIANNRAFINVKNRQ